jgi:hypothetical protein
MTGRTIIFISLFTVAMTHTIRAQEHIKYSVFAVEYIGESDKPITPIIISDSKAGATWYRNAVMGMSESDHTYAHVVSASLLKKLIADVDALKGTVQQKGEKNLTSSETVAVAVITPERSNRSLYGTDSAISLLESLEQDCEKSDSLRSDLAHFRDRIRAWK